METHPQRILFVCLGNICRSPMAESIFAKMVVDEELADQIEVDSAGTGHWHVGETPDSRTVSALAKNDTRWCTTARQIRGADKARFDWVLAMDRANYRDLERLGFSNDRLHLMMSFDPDGVTEEVPDPYYGTQRDFDEVYAMLIPACRGLLEAVKARLP